MNNLEIIELINELKISNFLGVYMKDEIKNIHMPRNSDFYFIYNLQTSKENGSHWLVDGRSKNQNIHMCPFGSDPCNEFIEFIGTPIISSTFRIQEFTEKSCGLYCILLLYLLDKGNSFEDSVLELFRAKIRSA